MNSIAVMRLLQGLNRPSPALLPLNTGGDDREERGGGSRGGYGGRGGGESRGGGRRYRSPSPEERPRGRREKKSPVRKSKKREPSSSSEETEGYGSESSYSSYDEPEVIKKRYKEDPCENISPATLSQKKTKKEVVNYLEEKACPKIETHAKRRKHVPATVPSIPPTNTAPPPPPVVANSPPPVASSKSVAPPVKNEVVSGATEAEPTKKRMGRPPKPKDPNAKPKKAPSAYNLAVAKFRKQGQSFTDAVKSAKAELASK